MNKVYLVTGGAGFIGSCVIRYLMKNTNNTVINVDKLTYAGSLSAIEKVSHLDRYFFEQADICDSLNIERIFKQYKPDIVMHLAAESHVDRSISGASTFIQTNIVGTYNLLDKARDYWKQLNTDRKKQFRFHHVSTDEVYGDLVGTNDLFTEEMPYAPSSPYSASKASSDHLVRAWHRTYGLPIIISNCSNNYGPYQFPEKLIPVTILNALNGKPIPVYGNGNQIRDWLYVDDHAKALILVANKGKIGETYNIGSYNENKNIEVVHKICHLLDELIPKKNSYKNLIEFVVDRLGHDIRYAIDSTKIEKDLCWHPEETFETGLRKTVKWFLANLNWCDRVKLNEDIKKS